MRSAEQPHRHCPGCGLSIPSPRSASPSCGHPHPQPPAPVPAAAALLPAEELRPVTALFADVVGSTSLAEHISPSDTRAIIGETVNRMARSIQAFGGVVGSYMGDGIAAFFGLPTAHDDDPHRAALAALQIKHSVASHAADLAHDYLITIFNVRIGINTGLASTGPTGLHPNRSLDALGDSVNVAARLQAAAPPGTILVAHTTASRLRPHFRLQPIGPLTLRGRTDPVPAYQLLGPAAPELPGFRTTFIGRDSELALLRSCLQDVTLRGRARIAIITGDPGIGKTRLVRELRHVCTENILWLEGRCPTYASAPFFQPIADMLRSWLALPQSASRLAARAKLTTVLSTLPVAQRADRPLLFLGELLGVLEDDDRDHLRQLGPQLVREQLLSHCQLWLRALCHRTPLCLILDDAQGCSPDTRALIEFLLPLTDELPILWIICLRPEPGTEGWKLRTSILADYSHRAAEIQLGPLPRPASEHILNELLPHPHVPRDTRQQVLARSQGNPLFIEELAGAILDALPTSPYSSRPTSPDLTPQLPLALATLLVARMDRLPTPVRQVAQLASLLGRRFAKHLLEQLAGADTTEAIRHLLKQGILVEITPPPTAEYLFRHPLFHEALLSTIPAQFRVRLHAQIARTLERLHTSGAATDAYTLAYHYECARDWAKACQYGDTAGDHAAEVHAPVQAQLAWQKARTLAALIRQWDRWYSATAKLARLFARSGEINQALSLFDEFVSHKSSSERTGRHALHTSARQPRRLALRLEQARTWIAMIRCNLIQPPSPLLRRARILFNQYGGSRDLTELQQLHAPAAGN